MTRLGTSKAAVVKWKHMLGPIMRPLSTGWLVFHRDQNVLIPYETLGSGICSVMGWGPGARFASGPSTWSRYSSWCMESL